MAKTIRDGWHEIAGYRVYVESGRIKHGITQDGQRTTWPYRKSKDGGWDNEAGLTVDAFRAGVNRGTIIMS